MILIDTAGKLWQVMISANGQLVTEALTPQPTVIITDPTGGQWQVGVTTQGVITTTKL